MLKNTLKGNQKQFLVLVHYIHGYVVLRSGNEVVFCDKFQGNCALFPCNRSSEFDTGLILFLVYCVFIAT